MINSPNNPTGEVMPWSHVEKIAAVVQRHNVLVITDEVYNTLIYDDSTPYRSIASLPGMKERTVVVNSFSKAYAMTGWRIGYAAGPADIIDRMVKCQENFNACVNAPGQYAAVVALNHPELTKELRDVFAGRRKAFLEGLSDISAFRMSSQRFCERLLLEQRVVCIPGSAFGECGEGFIRVAYTCGEEKLLEALERLRTFCAKI